MTFLVIIENRAASELQDAIDYYDEQQAGLGRKFVDDVNKSIAAIARNPFYQIRYSTIRCLPLKKFPFMIHFHVDEPSKIVKVFAIIHDARNPEEQYPKI